ncbi:MAG: hypothetical protein ACI9LM_003074 [Alteromonadaceae bacterium]|jgi:uncharacterized protein YifE (UPF0438 family)
MTLIHGFIFEKEFYDDGHFPRGFQKSGEFSVVEAEVLISVGQRLFMLEKSFYKPENQVEEQFVKMCKSNIAGQTTVELLWQKYKTLTKHKAFYRLNEST